MTTAAKEAIAPATGAVAATVESTEALVASTVATAKATVADAAAMVDSTPAAVVADTAKDVAQTVVGVAESTPVAPVTTDAPGPTLPRAATADRDATGGVGSSSTAALTATTPVGKVSATSSAQPLGETSAAAFAARPGLQSFAATPTGATTRLALALDSHLPGTGGPSPTLPAVPERSARLDEASSIAPADVRAPSRPDGEAQPGNLSPGRVDAFAAPRSATPTFGGAGTGTTGTALLLFLCLSLFLWVAPPLRRWLRRQHGSRLLPALVAPLERPG